MGTQSGDTTLPATPRWLGYGGIQMPDSEYFWVVLCKNHRYHKQQNLFFGHKIPLAETNAFLSPPLINGALQVRCDDCGEEYAYQSKDLVRFELEYPVSFTPHPLFEQA